MKKTISVILLSSVIATTVLSTPMSLFAAEEKPQSNTGKTSEETEKEEQEERNNGKEYGTKLGLETGNIKGKKDALNGESYDWEKRYLEMGNIVPPYDASKDNNYIDGFKEGFKEAFEKGYGAGYIDVMTDRYDAQVIKDIAEEMGIQDAISDFYNKLPIDGLRHLLTDEEIIKKFDLSGENPAYLEVFLVIFKHEYDLKYKEKYRELRNDDFMIDAAGYKAGKEVGTKMGDAVGKMAFVTPTAKNDWEKALKTFEKQQSLEQRYFLDREPEQYKTSFITGFREAFRIAFNAAYQQANIDISMNNINFVNVSMLPEELKFIPSDGVGKAGGTLKIPSATFYQETHIGVSMERDSFNYKNNKYTPATHIYNVAVANNDERIKLNKSLDLDLVYLGVQRAGIYQLIGSEWRYQYTTVTDGNLHTEIPEGMYRGGRYAIFIDEDYVPILDIRSHWAQKELYTFLRRDYIKGDQNQKYNPNAKMNRGEFLTLLGSVFNWNVKDADNSSVKFADEDKFGAYKNSINYAHNMGYVGGHKDGTFRPNDQITYNQIEWILRSVLQDQKFTWDTYEKMMKTERFTISDSVKGKHKPVSRGEIVYMLYEIQNNVI